MSKSRSILALVETALFAAFAMALSLLPDIFSWFTPSWGTLAILLLSLRRGPFYGSLGGVLWGLLHIFVGKAYTFSFLQVLIEYGLAYSSLGVAGFFVRPFQQSLEAKRAIPSLGWASLATTCALIARYFWHFLAGILFWADYAPAGTSPVLYSLTVNAGTFLSTELVALAFLVYLLRLQPTWLHATDRSSGR